MLSLNKKVNISLVALMIASGLLAQETTKSVEKAMTEANYQKQIAEQAKVKTVPGYKIASDKLDPIYVTGYGLSARKNIDPKDLKSKEISTEVTASKALDIYIENNNRNLEIKTWDQPKVKLVTTIYYEGEEGTKVSDEEWFEKLNISVRAASASIKIKSGTVSGGSYTINGSSFGWSSSSGVGRNDVAVFNEKGQSIGTQSKLKRNVTIYVPKENKLDIETKYAEVLISGNLNKLNVDITNGGLEMQDVTNLTLRSKYANISAGNIKTGEVELINGRFIAKDADDLDLDTKYASIEAGTIKKLILRSTNDEYEIEEVGTLQGRKNYGNLRITKLNNSLDLDGTNADIKVRNIAATLESIRINNKYADIRLPMRNVKNYSVAYQGAYSTVYAGFDKKPVEEKTSTAKTETSAAPKLSTKEEDLITASIRAANRAVKAAQFEDGNSDNHFTATVGDGKGAKLDLKCQNCTVDFK
jgi:hypothetical protein